MTSGLRGHVDAAQFRKLAGKSSQLEPKLKSALRRRIKAAATVAAEDARQTVQQAPGSQASSSRSTGLRQDIASGIQVVILTGARAGVTIKSSTNDQAHPASVVRGYDNPHGWKHPAWQSGVTVHQMGRPYFASRIRRHQGEITRAVRAAMADAAQTLK